MTIPYALGSTTATGRSVEINGVALYVEAYGVGEPLVLLHGFGGSGQNWLPFVPELAERYRLVIVDLPGHGHSTNPGNVFTHRQAAADVLLLLDSLGIGRFRAMGISTGGMTLLHMAIAQPDRIEAMVLISATTHFPDQARAIMRGASLDRMPAPVQQMYRACATRGEQQVRDLIAQFNALADTDDDMNLTAANLSAITGRTLVVHGDRDRFFPTAVAERLHQGIPGASLWIIPGGEHAPLYDAGVPFTARALQFLAQADSAGP